MSEQSKPWRCEKCGAVIGNVSQRGLRCDVKLGLLVRFEGLSAWVRCEHCYHWSPWFFEKEMLDQALHLPPLDK